MNRDKYLDFEQWLDSSYKPGLDAAEIATYRLELESFDYVAVMAATRAVSLSHAEPGKWRPKPMEIVAALTAEVTAPVPAEAFELLYGDGGVFSVAGVFYDHEKGASIIFSSAAEMEAANRGPREERAAELHPLLGAFVRTRYARLRDLPVDGEHGGAVRHRLAQEWAEFVSQAGQRERSAALGAGRTLTALPMPEVAR